MPSRRGRGEFPGGHTPCILFVSALFATRIACAGGRGGSGRDAGLLAAEEATQAPATPVPTTGAPTPQPQAPHYAVGTFPPEEIVSSRNDVCDYCWNHHHSSCVMSISPGGMSSPFPYSGNVLSAYVCAFASVGDNLTVLYQPDKEGCDQLKDSYFCPMGHLNAACSSCLDASHMPCINLRSYLDASETASHCVASSLYDCYEEVATEPSSFWCDAKLFTELRFDTLRGQHLVEDISAELSGGAPLVDARDEETPPDLRNLPAYSPDELDLILRGCWDYIDYEGAAPLLLRENVSSTGPFISARRGYCLQITMYNPLWFEPTSLSLEECATQVGYTVWCPDVRLITLYTLGNGESSATTLPPLEASRRYGGLFTAEYYLDTEFLKENAGSLSLPGQPFVSSPGLYFMKKASPIADDYLYVDGHGAMYDLKPQEAYREEAKHGRTDPLDYNTKSWRVGVIVPERVGEVPCTDVAAVHGVLVVCRTGEVFMIRPKGPPEEEGGMGKPDAPGWGQQRGSVFLDVLTDYGPEECWSRAEGRVLPHAAETTGVNVFLMQYDRNLPRQHEQGQHTVKAALSAPHISNDSVVILTRKNCLLIYTLSLRPNGTLSQSAKVVESSPPYDIDGVHVSTNFLYAYNRSMIWRYTLSGGSFAAETSYITFYAVDSQGAPIHPSLTMTNPLFRPESQGVGTVEGIEFLRVFALPRDRTGGHEDVYAVIRRGITPSCSGCPMFQYAVVPQLYGSAVHNPNLIFRIPHNRIEEAFASSTLSSFSPIVDVYVVEQSLSTQEVVSYADERWPDSHNTTFPGEVPDAKETLLYLLCMDGLRFVKLFDGKDALLISAPPLSITGESDALSLSVSLEVVNNEHVQKVFVNLNDGCLVFQRNMRNTYVSTAPESNADVYVLLGGLVQHPPREALWEGFSATVQVDISGYHREALADAVAESPEEASGARVVSEGVALLPPSLLPRGINTGAFKAETTRHALAPAEFAANSAKRVVAYQFRGSIHIWDMNTRKAVRTIPLNSGNGVGVNWMHFTGPDQLLVSTACSHDGCPFDEDLASLLSIPLPSPDGGVLLPNDAKLTHRSLGRRVSLNHAVSPASTEAPAFRSPSGTPEGYGLLAVWTTEKDDLSALRLVRLDVQPPVFLDISGTPHRSRAPIPSEFVYHRGAVFLGPFLLMLSAANLGVLDLTVPSEPRWFGVEVDYAADPEAALAVGMDMSRATHGVHPVQHTNLFDPVAIFARPGSPVLWQNRHCQKDSCEEADPADPTLLAVQYRSRSAECALNCHKLFIYRVSSLQMPFNHAIAEVRYAAAVNGHIEFSDTRSEEVVLHVGTMRGIEEFDLTGLIAASAPEGGSGAGGVPEPVLLSPRRVVSHVITHGVAWDAGRTFTYDPVFDVIITGDFTGVHARKFDTSFILWDQPPPLHVLPGDYKYTSGAERCSYVDSNRNENMRSLLEEATIAEHNLLESEGFLGRKSYLQGAARDWSYTSPYSGLEPTVVDHVMSVPGGGPSDTLGFTLLLYTEGNRISYVDEDVFLPESAAANRWSRQAETLDATAASPAERLAILEEGLAFALYRGQARSQCGSCGEDGLNFMLRNDAKRLAFAVSEINSLQAFSFERQRMAFVQVEVDNVIRASLGLDPLQVTLPVVDRIDVSTVLAPFEWVKVLSSSPNPITSPDNTSRSNGEEAAAHPQVGHILLVSTGFHLFTVDLRGLGREHTKWRNTLQRLGADVLEASYEAEMNGSVNGALHIGASDPRMVTYKEVLAERSRLGIASRRAPRWEEPHVYDDFNPKEMKFRPHPPVLQPSAEAELPQSLLSRKHRLSMMQLLKIQRTSRYYHAITPGALDTTHVFATWGQEQMYHPISSYPDNEQVDRSVPTSPPKNLYFYRISHTNAIVQTAGVPLPNSTYYHGAFIDSGGLVLMSSRLGHPRAGADITGMNVCGVGESARQGVGDAGGRGPTPMYALNYFDVRNPDLPLQRGQFAISVPEFFSVSEVHAALRDAGVPGALSDQSEEEFRSSELSYRYFVNFTESMGVHAPQEGVVAVHFKTVMTPIRRVSQFFDKRAMEPRDVSLEIVLFYAMEKDAVSGTVTAVQPNATCYLLFRGDAAWSIFHEKLVPDRGMMEGSRLRFDTASHNGDTVLRVRYVDGQRAAAAFVSPSRGSVTKAAKSAAQAGEVRAREMLARRGGHGLGLIYSKSSGAFSVAPIDEEPLEGGRAATFPPPTAAPPSADTPRPATERPGTVRADGPQRSLALSTVIMVVVPSLLGTLLVLLVGTSVFIHLRRMEDDAATDDVGFVEHVVQMDDIPPTNDSIYTPV